MTLWKLITCRASVLDVWLWCVWFLSLINLILSNSFWRLFLSDLQIQETFNVLTLFLVSSMKDSNSFCHNFEVSLLFSVSKITISYCCLLFHEVFFSFKLIIPLELFTVAFTSFSFFSLDENISSLRRKVIHLTSSKVAILLFKNASFWAFFLLLLLSVKISS